MCRYLHYFVMKSDSSAFGSHLHSACRPLGMVFSIGFYYHFAHLKCILIVLLFSPLKKRLQLDFSFRNINIFRVFPSILFTRVVELSEVKWLSLQDVSFQCWHDGGRVARCWAAPTGPAPPLCQDALPTCWRRASTQCVGLENWRRWRWRRRRRRRELGACIGRCETGFGSDMTNVDLMRCFSLLIGCIDLRLNRWL